LDYLTHHILKWEKEDYEESLACRILYSYFFTVKVVPKFKTFVKYMRENLKDYLNLSNVFAFIKGNSGLGNPFIVLVFDETQILVDWEDNDTARKASYIYNVALLLQTDLLGNETKMSVFFTGLNTLEMKDLALLSSIDWINCSLELLTTSDLLTIVNHLIRDLYPDLKVEVNSNVFVKFLELILGNPRLFANFLASCSRCGLEYLEPSSQEVDLQSRLQSRVYPKHSRVSNTHRSIPFSRKGFSLFLSKSLYNDRDVMWRCVSNLYEDLKIINFKVIFSFLTRMTRQEKIFPYLIGQSLLQNNLVTKSTSIPHSKETFGSLEEKGVLYLNPTETFEQYVVKITYPILYHMMERLKPRLPDKSNFLDFKSTITWEENELTDVFLVLTKIWVESENSAESFDLKNVFPEFKKSVVVKKLKEFKIWKSDVQITSFRGVPCEPQGFINGKSAPWGDGGIVLELVKPTEESSYFYIILQSKRKDVSNTTEDFGLEFQKIFDKSQSKFIQNNVLFILLSDGERIEIDEEALKRYNTLAIERSLLKNFFGEIYAIIKDLKTQQSETVFIGEEIQHTDRPKRKPTNDMKFFDTIDSPEREEQEGKKKKLQK
jgi:hypothetical protein